MLSRTRRRAKLAFKGLLFDGARLQELVEVRRKNALEDSMGFRGQWEEHRRFQIDFLKSHGLSPAHTLLEIGCGPLTGGVPIIGYLQPSHYFGIDIRESVLNLAWQEVGLENLSAKNPRLIHSSTFGAGELGNERFDFVLSFSVLYHLSDELLAQYFSTVSARLKDDGRCFAQVNTHLPDSTWLEFPFLMRTVEKYMQFAAAANLEGRSHGTIEALGFSFNGPERFNEMLEFRRR
jgi:2-polyprenyl-3-methyl-5-hydroxy-6-metoxy-1,4-benzoquinol methylase